eukprot:GHUV01019066.1.p1 GENE.GHUV01019066.1~~GHUV01019066.1.p1  ORF type:complete len:138 (+),score=50.94 GHUV01019066.1:211-624(+)
MLAQELTYCFRKCINTHAAKHVCCSLRSLAFCVPCHLASGAGANTRDSPASITDYIPSEQEVGGWFDDAKRAKRIYASKSQAVQQQQKQQHAQQDTQHARPMPRGGSATALAEAVAAADAEQQQSGAAVSRHPMRES